VVLEAMSTAISAFIAKGARDLFEHCGYRAAVRPF